MNALIENLRALGNRRLAVLGAVFVGMLALLGVVVLQSGGGSTDALLYRDLDPKEASGIADHLDKAHIAYALRDQGQTILVAQDKVAAARLLLAKDGLPSGGSVGYELFDRGSNLTQTQFEQSINETRALEGELERSIRLLRGVKSARVHLVLAHRELFSAEEQTAQASVLLTLNGNQRLDPEGVSAVLNLVAAAVPGLRPQNIAIVDNRGDVLARAGSITGSGSGSQSVEEQRQAMEMRLSRSVEDMLNSVVGMGHVRVEAAVQMNTDHVHETQERYDPDQQVLRSQQTNTEKNVNTQGSANVTVGNNLPNANAGQPQSGSQSSRQQETDNYEIGKTVRVLVQDQPRVSRLSIAVMVDGLTHIDGHNQPVWTPRDKDELSRLTDLTKSAVGYDAARGDTVTVMSMRFTSDDNEAAPHEKTIMGLNAAMLLNGQVTRTLVFVVTLLAVGFFIVRPLLSPKRIAPAAGVALSPMSAGGAIERLDQQGTALVASSGPSNALNAIASSDDGLITVSGVEGRIKASSIQRVLDLVETHPDESIAMIRGWLASEQGGPERA
ncbi:flagellar basal-body MS-ring/collar protein FliF [Tanticharoenia sakaeratensis]|uniref:Flagellar M-ring protein n=1 Tax=Tanticharoenia sakaeratensis NBRC 103193 TaxID=1231623 RepID=A0A0D6MHQ1_9PROT|nr:flagellar basal-body MS-ring/collar protein FliF [Tanticharoenia sakaeratensis]GAN52990.1 flagellar MS-ring protein [Tanticharoenia sakaeratensis NBRC 103193]GBQ19838.1 flagellar MS-ring protein [Tanticharoenia sakaeratensis NBRC 103193]